MQKRIGIVGWKTGENSFGTTLPYLIWIQKFGKPVILTPDDVDVQDVDLLILPGGMDMTPQSYGERPSYRAGNIDVMKQYFYDIMLPQYVNAGIPIFGICLGAQQLAAYFGSVLTQDLPFHPYSPSNERWKDVHDVECINSAAGMFKKDKFKVNSLHHQAVLLKNLSNELEAMLVAENEEHPNQPGYNIVEAFRHKERKIAAVQYHPEEFGDLFSTIMVRSLIGENPTGSPAVKKLLSLYK